MEKQKNTKRPSKTMTGQPVNQIEIAPEYKTNPLKEAVLSLAQRRKRSISLRRRQSRIQRQRDIASRRFASSKSLKRRSQKLARALVRARVAGKRGASYNALTASDKIAIDRQIQNKQKMISAIAARMYQRVRKREMERLAKVRSGKTKKGVVMSSYDPNQENKDITFETFSEMYDQIMEGRALGIVLGKLKDIEARKSIERETAQREKERIEKELKDKREKEQEKPSTSEERIIDNLIKKSEKNNMDINQVFEAFIKSLDETTNEEQAFNKLNSFIAFTKNQKITEESDDEWHHTAPPGGVRVHAVLHHPASGMTGHEFITGDGSSRWGGHNIVKWKHLPDKSKGFAKGHLVKFKGWKGVKLTGTVHHVEGDNVHIKDISHRIHVVPAKDVQFNEAVNYDIQEAAPLHKVAVTVAGKKKGKITKFVRVGGGGTKEAIKRAKKYYNKAGFKVHSAKYHSYLPEEFVIDRSAGLGALYFAKDMGINIKPGFEHHPDVLEMIQKRKAEQESEKE